jgi:ribosomal protein S18 acetylase RimI-like enzyme
MSVLNSMEDVYVDYQEDMEELSEEKQRQLQAVLYQNCFQDTVTNPEELAMVGEGFMLRKKSTHELLAAFLAVDTELAFLEGRVGRYVTWVCTLESSRKQGYMKFLLVSALLQWRKAGAAGPKDLTLYVMRHKVDAVRLYQSVGFRIVNYVEMEAGRPLKKVPTFVMYMPLHRQGVSIDGNMSKASSTMAEALCYEIRTIVIDAATAPADHKSLAFDSAAVLNGPAFFTYLDRGMEAPIFLAVLVLEPIDGEASSFYISLAANRSYFHSCDDDEVTSFYTRELLEYACKRWEGTPPKKFTVIANPLQWETCLALQEVGYVLKKHADGAEAHLTLNQALVPQKSPPRSPRRLSQSPRRASRSPQRHTQVPQSPRQLRSQSPQPEPQPKRQRR